MEDYVSVIMLTYNREKLVGDAVKSVLDQTYKNFELIIIDNGSTDSSGFICDEWAGKDKRIRCFHTEKNSIGKGRNIGLENAVGKYITFVDDDDVADPIMLEYLVNIIKTGDYDISMCGSVRESDGNIENKYVFEGYKSFSGVECVKELLKRELFNSANPTKLFKKGLFDDIRYEETGKYDDISVMYKIYAKAEKVVAGGRPLYTFRRHVGNNSGFTTNKKMITPDQLKEYLKAFHQRTEYLSKCFPEEKDFFLYQELSYMISMCKSIKEYELKSCENEYLIMFRVIKENLNILYLCPWLKQGEKEYLDVCFR